MFKSKESGEDYKKKREVYAEDIRKNNRNEIFSKRRNIIEDQPKPTEIQLQSQKLQKLLIVDERYYKQIEQFLKATYTMDNFIPLVHDIQDPDILKQHRGVIGIRKILSIHNDPPIQHVIDAGLVPKMIQYVKQQSYPQLQLEATWTLTNVASGSTNQCQSIIDKGGIPLFINLILKSNLGIVEQAIWAIGNIASDNPFYRDSILKEGGLINLVKLASYTKDPTILKHTAWSLSNLCRGNPLPKYDLVKAAIPTLCQFVKSGILNQDKQILSDVCWAISYNTETHRDRIQKLIQSGIVECVISFLSTSYLPLLVPSIRIVGNISTGTPLQTDQILRFDILASLQVLLDHYKKVVRRQTCWVLSNISAGTRQQIDVLLSRESLISKLIRLFQSDANEVKKQICFVFSNFSYNGEAQTIMKFYQQNAIVAAYINLLGADQPKLVETTLECLFHILAVGEKVRQKTNGQQNLLVGQIIGMGAVDILEKLQYHQSQVIYGQVVKILQNYFEIQDPLQG